MVVNVYTQGFSSIANGKINRAKVHAPHWLVKAHLGNGCIEVILGGQPHKLAHVHVCVCVCHELSVFQNWHILVHD